MLERSRLRVVTVALVCASVVAFAACASTEPDPAADVDSGGGGGDGAGGHDSASSDGQSAADGAASTDGSGDDAQLDGASAFDGALTHSAIPCDSFNTTPPDAGAYNLDDFESTRVSGCGAAWKATDSALSWAGDGYASAKSCHVCRTGPTAQFGVGPIAAFDSPPAGHWSFEAWLRVPDAPAGVCFGVALDISTTMPGGTVLLSTQLGSISSNWRYAKVQQDMPPGALSVKFLVRSAVDTCFYVDDLLIATPE